jgi:3-oxoacyl-[acyl-carrier protein] reductase
MQLKGKVALVTGGSRGLGAAIVRDLAHAEAAVAFTYSRDRKAARALAEEIRSRGGAALPILADVQNYDRAQEVVKEVVDEFDSLDALVCNAGVARSAALPRMREEDWDQVIDVTLKGAFNYVRAAAPVFQNRRAGKIVCIGSINGLRGRVGTVGYNVAKAGLLGLVKTAAAELGRHNVNVNLVAPGFIETDSQQNTPELIRKLVLDECAIKRLGQPEDIAPLITFLCSESARHITGAVIKADAGQYL